MSNEQSITVLFTDVVGSTQLRTARGDTSAHQILKRHFELVRPFIKQFSGQEVKTMGDSLMVAFGSAQSAVDCAVAVQRALAEHNHTKPDESISVRMGLNTGMAINEEGDFFGTAIDAASRILSKAAGGQILLSETTREAIAQDKDVAVIDRGPFWLKGFPDRWRLYEVLWHEEKVSIAYVPVPTMEMTPFVGRENELAELRRHLEQAKLGQGSLIMLAGEPGVGKSRLAEEIMAEAHLYGLFSFSGRCYDMQGAPPYLPFVEIIEGAVRTVEPERLRAALGDSAPEVTKLMPELRHLFPDIPPPPGLPPEQERHCLFNGVRDFMERASQNQPLLVVLEDLQWADESTLHLLRHIAQRLHEMPILVLGTYRDTEVDKAVWLARCLEELLRHHMVKRVTLKRLSEPAVAAMLEGCAGQETPASIAHMIFTETGGNPFFVEELFKHLSEEGKLFDSSGRWRCEPDVEELDVPETVRLVIEHRLGRVGKGCRGSLIAASIIGRGFTYELLKELVDLDEADLLDAVDEAEAAQLISSKIDCGEVRYSFFHELIRQTLLSSLTPLRRQRLHLRAANVLELLYSNCLEEHANELAYHLSEAGTLANWQKTVHYLQLAGDRAYQMAAPGEAIQFYANALSFRMADEIQAEIRCKLGSAYSSLGKIDEALDEWRKALEIWEKLGNAEEIGQICAEISPRLLWAARLQEAFEICTRGLAALGDCVNSARCILLASSASMLSYVPASGYDMAGTLLAEALRMAEELKEENLLGPILTRKAMLHRNYWQAPEEVDAGLRAAELLRSANKPFDLTNALLAAQWGLIQLGRLAEAERISAEIEALSPRSGDELDRCVGGLYDSFREVVATGDLDRFEKRTTAYLKFSLSVKWAWVPFNYISLGWAQFWRGRWDEARENFRKGAELMDPRAEGFIGFLIGPLLLFSAYSGSTTEALQIMEQRRDILPSAGQANTLGAWTMLEAAIEALAIMGKVEEAAALYPLTQEAIAAGNLIRPSFAGLVQTSAGIAAAAAGKWEEAEQHYLNALRQAHEIPHTIEQPEVRRWYARMLVDRKNAGDYDKAHTLLTEASELYHKIGMFRHLRMAQDLIAEIGR